MAQILPQLDPRTQPRSLLMAMPRLNPDVTAVDVAELDAIADITQVDIAKLPVPNLGPSPEPRPRSRTGANLHVRKVGDATKVGRLERELERSKGDRTKPVQPDGMLHVGDITKPFDGVLLSKTPSAVNARIAKPAPAAIEPQPIPPAPVELAPELV